MRVYEFSKKYNVSSKDVINRLLQAGLEVKSHMSVLDDQALEFLMQSFEIKKTSTTKQIKEEQASVKEPFFEPAPAVRPSSEPALKLENEVQAQEQKQEQKIETPTSTASAFEGIVPQAMRLVDAAATFGCSVSELILLVLKWGMLANKNMILPEQTVIRLAEHFQVPIRKREKNLVLEKIKKGESGSERSPIVVVVGHVDHGKTTLLDYIRNTCVASREKGGITQHLGAYEAFTSQGNVVFLDTPGHEAFAKIRGRGVKIADIAILVVAADDGIMPQTVESIKLALALEVPIIVAINKIDKVEPARIETVKRELAQYNLLLEEWGGDVIVVPISAKKGINIDQLLDMIILKSQIMELRAAKNGPAQGYILESKIEKGRGPVATLICLQGEVQVGDFFIAGASSGRVSSLNNSYGQRITKAGPSIPVQVAGFDELVDAGEPFTVVDVVVYRAHQKGKDKADASSQRLATAGTGKLKLVIKTDTNSSKEALIEAIEKLSKKSEIGFSIVHAAIGQVSESDVVYASSTGAMIVTLHVKPEPNAALLAQKHSVQIRQFYIIYELLDSLKELSERSVKPKMVRKKVGEAIVRRVFDIKNIGVIAGCYVSEGYFTRDSFITIWRGNKKIGEGKMNSLQREKRAVKQVHSGFECGFLVDSFNEWLVDDRAECFIEVPKEK